MTQTSNLTQVDSEPGRPGAARRAVAGTAALIGAIAWTHSLAALLRPFGPEGAPLAAGSLTLAAVAVTLVGILAWPRRGAPGIAAGAGLAAAVVVNLIQPGSFVSALGLVPVAAFVTAGAGWVAGRLPAGLDAWPTRHRALATLWAIVALMAVVQTGRLTTWMTDFDYDWYLSTRHPFWAKHECASAYFYAAELNDRGERNLYDAAHYPGLNPEAEAETHLAGMVVEDPYQYAPQFLLWPRLALALSDNYPAIRMTWFGMQMALLMGAVLGLALWIGGRAGRIAAYWSPAVLASFPMLHNLQYGQFHFAAVALAVLAMIAFDRGRRPLGGALLAVSILSKLFPGILLIPMIVQRRWRDLAWTAAAGAVLTGAALLFLGPQPFVAFFDYHLPRLGSGDAFSFGEAWPEVRELVIAANQGAFGVVTKLAEMGVPGANAETAIWVKRLYLLALLVAAALVGLALPQASRFDRGTAWLALLGLGSMVSTGAFADYVPLTCVWLLSLWIVRTVDSRRLAIALGACAVMQFFLLGAVPIGDWTPFELMMPVSALGVLAMMAVFGWTLVEARRAGYGSSASLPSTVAVASTSKN